MWHITSFIVNSKNSPSIAHQERNLWTWNESLTKLIKVQGVTKLYKYQNNLNQHGGPKSENKIQRNPLIKMVKDIIIVVAAASTKRGIGFQGKLVRFGSAISTIMRTKIIFGENILLTTNSHFQIKFCLL
jgi:hypothetical protein